LDLLDAAPRAVALSSWLQEGYLVLPLTSPRYPPVLWELTDPPPLLFLMGRRELLLKPAVTLVGSRRATEVGRRSAETMGRLLAEAGVTVISGMALGIDGAAHRGALAGGGNTVAVLGSGFGVVYPSAHRELFSEIGQRGLLVTEFLPEEPALPHHFPKRNRILAALARAVIVVEAGKKSGALITVDHGLDLGRDILVTPGSVENPSAFGSNALLKEGARVLPDPAAVVEELEQLGWALERASGKDPGSTASEPPIPTELRPIWSALAENPLGVDEVASRASMSAAEVMAGLSALELGGWVSLSSGMRYRRK
jgi:DNA processing protein